MNRSLTAVFAGLEAMLVAAIGIAIPLVPLTILWSTHYEFAIDWIVFWRAAVDMWLVGHGVDIRFTLDPDTAAGLGLPGAEAPFAVSIAALGFALLTALLGSRAGRRFAQTNHRGLAQLVSIAVFAVFSLAVTSSALYPLARPSLVQGALLPAFAFALGVVIGSARQNRPAADGSGSSIRDWVNDWRPWLKAIALHVFRGGVAAAALVTASAAVLLAGMILVGYSQVIALYEALHTDVAGGVAMTLGQLAFLPNLVIWAAAWLVGPGFAIGAGSAVSPLSTALGPIPTVPLLGILPTGEHALGFLGLLVPVLAGFFAAILIRHRPSLELDSEHRWPSLVAVCVGVGLLGGAILGLLAWASAGSAGPGRLAEVGPDPLSVGVWAAVEVGTGALAGLLATARGASRGKAPR